MLSAALTDWRWCNEQVAALPPRFERHLISRYTAKYQSDSVAANVWLRRVVSKIKRVKLPSHALTSDSAALSWASEYYKIRYTTAHDSFLILDELPLRFRRLCDHAAAVGIAPPVSKDSVNRDELALAVYKMDQESWWQRQAKTIARRAREYMAIALGLVGKGAQSYCSAELLSHWRHDQQSAAEFLAANWIGLDIENDYGADQLAITLADASASSVSNPEIRRLEMMCRIRGIEETAKAAGMVGLFLTWTAPSAYHFNAGRRWNGADPRDTQRYLTKQWQKCRAVLNKNRIAFSGIRVVEPHQDETPHWHLLLFVAAEQKNEFLAICRRYALQHDSEEKGAQQHRFIVETIDPEKGSAVGYIAKYISKSINGAKCDDLTDNDTGLPFDDTADRCRAWASCWSIRQFQFVGVPSVTIWRELRRVNAPLPCQIAEPIRAAADKGQFAKFIELMGGLCAPRDVFPVKALMSEKTGSDGVTRKKIEGIKAGSFEKVTRAVWVRLGNVGASFERFLERQRASGAAWTRGNNCNLQQKLESLAERGNAALDRIAEIAKAVAVYMLPDGSEKIEVTEYDEREFEQLRAFSAFDVCQY